MTFETSALFDNCPTVGQDVQEYDEEDNSLYDASSGGRSAIYQQAKGTVTCLDDLNMTDNNADIYVSAGALNDL